VAEPKVTPSERLWEEVDCLVSVDQALDRILAAVSPLPGETVHIAEALGRVLTADFYAVERLPPFHNSAMDGYAVRSSDTLRASRTNPVVLEVTGAVAAGQPPGGAVGPAKAFRIMTGAPVPRGADAVVRFEDTVEDGETAASGGNPGNISIFQSVEPGANVRCAGEDVASGSLAISAGSLMRPQEIGLLAAMNVERVTVHRSPSVAILSTGNEIVDIGGPLRPGQIRDSNSYQLAAMVSQAGAIPEMIGVARDSFDDLTEKLHRCRTSDLIVTSGGVSVGAYDVVKEVLRSEGTIEIWQVRMKPGKPLAFGTIGSTPIIGLPGNPVAAAVGFEAFAKPAIKRMLGLRDVSSETVSARLTEQIENTGHRRQFVRATLEGNAGDGYTVRSAGAQGSGMLSSLTRANSLMIIPEDVAVARPGMMVEVQILH
jgi:molybdopterin molybdotransferase